MNTMATMNTMQNTHFIVLVVFIVLIVSRPDRVSVDLEPNRRCGE
jgi:hypothetical protein